jgi:hypothetical protein
VLLAPPRYTVDSGSREVLGDQRDERVSLNIVEIAKSDTGAPWVLLRRCVKLQPAWVQQEESQARGGLLVRANMSSPDCDQAIGKARFRRWFARKRLMADTD